MIIYELELLDSMGSREASPFARSRFFHEPPRNLSPTCFKALFLKKDRRNLIRRSLIRYTNKSRVFVNIGLDFIFVFFVLVRVVSGGGGGNIATCELRNPPPDPLHLGFDCTKKHPHSVRKPPGRVRACQANAFLTFSKILFTNWKYSFASFSLIGVPPP